jgi:hypothetical protein
MNDFVNIKKMLFRRRSWIEFAWAELENIGISPSSRSAFSLFCENRGCDLLRLCDDPANSFSSFSMMFGMRWMLQEELIISHRSLQSRFDVEELGSRFESAKFKFVKRKK